MAFSTVASHLANWHEILDDSLDVTEHAIATVLVAVVKIAEEFDI